MRQVQPTILIGVPRLFEKIRQAIESRAAQASPMKRALFGWAQRCGLRYARRRLERPEGSDGTGAGSSVGLFLRFSHRLAERLVLSKVRGRARRPPALDLRWRSGAAGVGQLVVPLLRVEPRAGLRSYGKLAGDLRQCRRHEPRGQRWRALGQCRGAHCRGRRGSHPRAPCDAAVTGTIPRRRLRPW